MMSLNREANNWLRHRFGQNVKFDEPMSKHTYFGIGGPVDAFVVPQRRKDLIDLIIWAGQMQQPYIVIGDGTNLLVRDAGIRGLVIVLTKCLNKISRLDSGDETTIISAMAGARLQALCKFAIESGLEGMNFAIGIPGTVGGGIMMNAGTAAGSMEGVLDSIEVLLPGGERLTIERGQLVFRYRKLSLINVAPNGDLEKTIILEGRFQLQPSDARYLKKEAQEMWNKRRMYLKKEAQEMWNKRRMAQPSNYASAGCFFKNPASGKTAGELIELAGLKGKRVGGAEVSSKHANFIINTDNATAADVMALMEIVQETVSQTFNIELKPEVKIVGTQA
jgi:UDP-N-acetylmuramate dehydrogenase